jgi:hypothetical protein
VPTRRIMSLGVVLLVTVPWALAMSVLGLWVMFAGGEDAMGGVFADRRVAIGVGASALACGQLVFMVCVCDRVFPRASRRVVMVGEASAGCVFLAALLGVGVLALV